MKRLIVLLVVLALASYLAFKAGAWWLTDQRFQEADQAVGDVGVINHGQIRSSISGTLTLVEGSYQDFRLSQPLEFGRLTFDARSAIDLVTALFDPSMLPQEWLLRAEQLSMTLDTSLLSDWVTDSGEETRSVLFAPVCGPDHRQQLGTGDLRRLGITSVGGEMLIRQKPAELYAEVTTVETGSVEIRWPGARLDPLDPMSVLTSSAQPMSVTLRDGGLMRRVSAYCARESGLDMDKWTQKVVESFTESLAARGYRASNQLIALYRQWLTEGGELGLELSPMRPLWGVPMNPSKPFVTYNGARVPDVFVEAIEPEPEAVPAEAVEPIVAGEANNEPGWRAAAIDSASALLGQTVRVTLANGNVVEGRLAGVDEKRMEIVRMVEGGEVAYPIAISQVQTFEVWRRGQNP